MFTVPSPPFHKDLARALTDPTLRKMIFIAPRGFAKSSIVACLWVMWHIFLEPRPKVVILVSKTEGHAIRLLLTIKNALDYSLPLRNVFGYWGEHSAKLWRQNEVVLKDGTAIICRGTGQQVVGLKHGDQRPTLVVVDDPEDMENTKTAEAMEYNLRWLLQALAPSWDPQRGRICVIGTPQHQRCIVETLYDAEGWYSRRWKALLGEPMGSEGSLWPEWHNVSALIKEKESLESIGRLSSFYREYQCEIVGDEDQLFKPNYLRYYDGVLFRSGKYGFMQLKEKNGVQIPALQQVVPVTIFTGIDPASSTSQTSDYSTIVSVAVDKDMNRYILPYFRKRVTPLALADAILSYDKKVKADRTRVESVGYQEMLREFLRSQAYIPGLEIKENPRTQKSKRLESMEPFFCRGKIHLLKNMQELKDELMLYPRGKHDDLLDALYYSMKGNYPPTHEYVENVGKFSDEKAEGIENGFGWLFAN
jgi:phage terminase large subunit-like protein